MDVYVTVSSSDYNGSWSGKGIRAVLSSIWSSVMPIYRSKLFSEHRGDGHLVVICIEVTSLGTVRMKFI